MFVKNKNAKPTNVTTKNVNRRSATMINNIKKESLRNPVIKTKHTKKNVRKRSVSNRNVRLISAMTKNANKKSAILKNHIKLKLVQSSISHATKIKLIKESVKRKNVRNKNA